MLLRKGRFLPSDLRHDECKLLNRSKRCLGQHVGFFLGRLLKLADTLLALLLFYMLNKGGMWTSNA